ncbi:MAG: hypothetical protein M3335_03900 [Actinomycetota bacterium]|nr:hypothetical protein [Actinomycetota bacterium]
MRWIKKRLHAVQVWLGPFFSGLAEALSSIAGLTFTFWAFAEANSLAHPSPQLFRDLAQVGSALLVAFAVATAGYASSTKGDRKSHIYWLGGACGIGLCGFVAVAASVGLAAYGEAGHAGWLDILGICWVAISIAMLGLLIAVLPIASYSWSRGDFR